MVLSRLGNKRRIAHRILPHILPHTYWLEPFFGAGGLFFAKERAKRNIVNDRDGEVFNLFCVVQDRHGDLEEAWASMPLHEDLWRRWKKEAPTDPVWRAVRFLFQSNFGFLGKPQTLRWNNKEAKRLLQQRIGATRELLYDVEFTNVDFRQFLRRIPLSKAERANAFVYADPPYLDTSNNYGEAAAWAYQDTADLFAELVDSGLRCAMSEFDHPQVLELARRHGMHTIRIGERHNLRNRRMEVLLLK